MKLRNMLGTVLTVGIVGCSSHRYTPSYYCGERKMIKRENLIVKELQDDDYSCVREIQNCPGVILYSAVKDNGDLSVYIYNNLSDDIDIIARGHGSGASFSKENFNALEVCLDSFEAHFANNEIIRIKKWLKVEGYLQKNEYEKVR